MELLRPITLGGTTARNRLLFGPHETNLGRRRSISDRHVAYYRRRAAGGSGVVVTEEASVDPSDWPYERAPLASECGPGWEAVAAACHAEGALAVAAIGHTGGQGSSAYSQLPLLAPSRVPEVNTREVPKWMEENDIRAVIAGFGAATRLALQAGMDGVELNAGQSSLTRQFLSGLTNHRADVWGADRTGFAVAVLEAVRDAAPGAVVGLRLCCDELAPWAGITPDAGCALAARFAPLVDYLVVVRGSIYSVSATRPDGHEPAGFNRGLTADVRAAVAGAVPVYWQGSVVDVSQAEEALVAGVCDGVEMTRAQLADANLAAKVRHGHIERIRPCILCNQACIVRDARNPIVSCVVEPSTGHETEDEPVVGDGPAPATATPRTRRDPHRPVLIVGAGPAGLEAARVLAQAGHHQVRILERRPRPGGMVPVAAAASGRGRLAAFTGWLEDECRRLRVDFELGRSAEAADLAGHDGPVILATGSRPAPPAFPVEPGAVVVDAATLLRAVGPGAGGKGDGEERLFLPDPPFAVPEGPALVWDPVGGPVAVSVAETLAATGGQVTLVTPDPVVGTQLSRTGDLAPATVRLERAGVSLIKRAQVVEAAQGTVLVADRYSAERTAVPASLLVDCSARLPDDDLWRRAGPVVTARVGDAVAPRTVLEAVLEGRRAAQGILSATEHDGRGATAIGAP